MQPCGVKVNVGESVRTSLAASLTEFDMPPVIVWALGAFGAAVAVKWLAREARRISAAPQSQDAARAEVRQPEIPTLEQDPVTGIYRPK